MKLFAIVGAISFALASPAYAKGPNAAELLQSCETAPGAPTDFCKSYISKSVREFSTGPISREVLCFPDGVTEQVITRAITLFVEAATAMDKYRGLEKLDAGSVLLLALEKGFLCQK